ncbi:BadF/BadG/BcrA/BcrD ATPase family protein [Ostreiculturibacter nitratireducens]|uniref:BadF/BadG/BcrA/BcrD ATPase family protein n=1 Tax=Ostreiculturibacter nitratireducens TaxID=3075226 RepID=UPI0031B62F97
MSHESLPHLIGVDGGGSSCRAALRLGPDGPRHEVTLGAANVSTNFDEAVATIREALGQLCEKAGLPQAELVRARAHLGLAGVMNEEIAGRVAAALPIGRAQVTDDRPTTLAGAFGDGNGAVAAIGTGSFLGRQQGGQQKLAGGWGFVIGDQASGAWIGRRLLEEVVLCVDGFSAETELVRDVLAAHGRDPSLIVAFSLSARPKDFADFARHVEAAAVLGDPLAKALMEEGAGYIVRGLASLGWRKGEPLCLMGGLGPAYAPFLPQVMQRSLVPPKGSALDGALALAARIPEGVT